MFERLEVSGHNEQLSRCPRWLTGENVNKHHVIVRSVKVRLTDHSCPANIRKPHLYSRPSDAVNFRDNDLI